MQTTWMAMRIAVALVFAIPACANKEDTIQEDERTAKVRAVIHRGEAREGRAFADLAPHSDEARQKLAAAAQSMVANDNRPPLSPDEYETLLLALAECPLKGADIDPACPAGKALRDARTRANAVKDLSGLTAHLGEKHLQHASPAVRMQAAALLNSVFGARARSQALIIDAARAETEPAVLAVMLDAVGSQGTANPDIGALLVDMAEHPSPAIRKKALQWLSSTGNRGVPGAIDALIRAIEKDPDPDVRVLACKHSGSRGDDRLVRIYGKYTRNSGKNPGLYSACMEGLMTSWLEPPLFETHSKKAYQLTLRRLARGRRASEFMPGLLLDRFAALSRDGEALARWRQKAPWYRRDDVLRVLEAIAKDARAAGPARSSALRSMIALGASADQLAAVAEALGKDRAGDTALEDILDQALAAPKGEHKNSAE